MSDTYHRIVNLKKDVEALSSVGPEAKTCLHQTRPQGGALELNNSLGRIHKDVRSGRPCSDVSPPHTKPHAGARRALPLPPPVAAPPLPPLLPPLLRPRLPLQLLAPPLRQLVRPLDVFSPNMKQPNHVNATLINPSNPAYPVPKALN